MSLLSKTSSKSKTLTAPSDATSLRWRSSDDLADGGIQAAAQRPDTQTGEAADRRCMLNALCENGSWRFLETCAM